MKTRTKIPVMTINVTGLYLMPPPRWDKISKKKPSNSAVYRLRETYVKKHTVA